MAVKLSSVVCEFSTIAPAIYRHFLYHNTEASVVIEPWMYGDRSALKLTNDALEMEIRLAMDLDCINVQVYHKGNMVDFSKFVAVVGEDRKRNVRQLIQLLDGTVSYEG